MKRKNKATASAQFFKDDDFKFEIVEQLAVLATYDSGWRKEFNIVKWNDKAPRLDLREWNSDHSRMSKGIGFSFEEAEKLKEALEHLTEDMLSYSGVELF